MKKYDYFIMIASSRSGHNFVKNNILSWLGIFNEEDANTTRKKYGETHYLNFENTTQRAMNRKLELNKVYSKNILYVILVRDYLNWVASYILLVKDKKERGIEKLHGIGELYGNPLENMESAILIWNMLVKEVYTETNYLPIAIKANYDCFRKYQEYRKEICKDIGGEYNEEYLNRVAKQGFYSSFDGLDYKYEAQKMKVDERYLQIMETDCKDDYIKVLKSNNEALHLYKTYFNISQDKIDFLKDIIGPIKPLNKKCCK